MRPTGRATGAAASLLLFCAFTACLLLVLASGAGAYRDIRQVGEECFSENTCVSYIATKVRHYDSAGDVQIGRIGDAQALQLREVIDGEVYVTSLYCSDGQVMELFYPEGLEFSPEDGTPVLAAQSLDFDVTPDGLLRVSCIGTSGKEASVELSLRSGEVAPS
ncbi:MAG TPA: DUF4860 domain-containing protein [Candidatus Acidoferrum sp.]|nr:DUF4860 domain-containing protein [Candidatus Acidoferrum sp.]